MAKSVRFTQTFVGKRVKRTKVRYSWTVALDEVEIVCDLLYSVLSKKVAILINSKPAYFSKNPRPFHFQVECQEHDFQFIKTCKGFCLLVDGTWFQNLPGSLPTKPVRIFSSSYSQPSNETTQQWLRGGLRWPQPPAAASNGQSRTAS